jgi:hypothetical protein
MMFVCDVGDVPAIKTVFTDANGTAIDPTTITLYLKPPSGAVGTYTYPADVTKLSAGTYSYNGTATAAGYWSVRWVGAGAAVAAEQSIYFVRSVNT